MTEQETEELLDALLAPPPAREGEPPVPERSAPEQDKAEFLAALLGTDPIREEGQTQNPTEGRIAKSRQSEPTSKRKEQADRGISEPPEHSRRSVRQEINEIKAEQRERAAGKEKSPRQKPARHKAPTRKKTKKGKER